MKRDWVTIIFSTLAIIALLGLTIIIGIHHVNDYYYNSSTIEQREALNQLAFDLPPEYRIPIMSVVNGEKTYIKEARIAAAKVLCYTETTLDESQINLIIDFIMGN